MQMNITGHHVDLTESLQEYTKNKLSKLSRFFDNINNVQVILKIESGLQIAEATLHVNQGELHASADSLDMYTSIDSLVDKLSRQLTKHKEKLNQH